MLIPTLQYLLAVLKYMIRDIVFGSEEYVGAKVRQSGVCGNIKTP
jgi:hypothetical protein